MEKDDVFTVDVSYSRYVKSPLQRQHLLFEPNPVILCASNKLGSHKLKESEMLNDDIEGSMKTKMVRGESVVLLKQNVCPT